MLVQWFVWSQSEAVCFFIFYFGSMILGSYIKIYYELKRKKKKEKRKKKKNNHRTVNAEL